MSGRVCGTCAVAGGDKYKCAHCKVFKYCSVACYKKHQEGGCTKETPGGVGSAASASAAAAPAVAAVAAAPAAPAVPVGPSKSESETVADADLDALARDPRILSALSSGELQRILRLIDGGGSEGAAADDESRVATLDKYRRSNADFEQFIQTTMQIINKE